MSRSPWLAAACLFAVVLSACSASEIPHSEESSLAADIKAPPVPKDRTTTTAPAPTPTDSVPSVTVPEVQTPAYWVSPDGDDAAEGTEDDPWGTLAHAATQLQPGDTLYLADGTYEETFEDAAWLIRDLNGNEDAWITIAAAPGAEPVVTGGEWKTIGLSDSSYVEIRGLEIVGSANGDRQPTSGIEAYDSHHLRIVGNYIHDGGGNGIGMINSNHVDVVDNYVAGMAKWNPFQTSGISFFESVDIGGGDDDDGYSMRIIGNTVYGTENIALPAAGGNVITDGNCIIIDTNDVTEYTGSTLVANNICSNNGGRGLHAFGSSNVLFVNNTLFHNMQTEQLRNDGGELTAIDAENIVFRNNLVIPRAERRFEFTHKAKATFDNNMYELPDGKGKPKGDTDMVVVDAGMEGAVKGDFTLSDSSPAVDAGSPEDAPQNDQSGLPRDSTPDIGARELVT